MARMAFLLDDHNVATSLGEQHRGGGAGWPATEDENIANLRHCARLGDVASHVELTSFWNGTCRIGLGGSAYCRRVL
jgi:hypothetical protein